MAANNNDKLTERQRNLVLNYVSTGGNLYQSAIRAKFGDAYARHNVYDDFQKRKIKNNLDKLRAQDEQDFAKRLGVTFEWRMNKLKRIVNSIVPDSGEIKHKYTHNAIKAMAEMTRMFGDYAPERKMNLTVTSTLDSLAQIKRQYKEY